MERFHIPKLFFVVLFLLETSRFCLCKNTSFDCFERERQALLSLKKSFIQDPLHILSSWEGTNCCKWKGVSCNTSNGHVVKLDLHYSDDQGDWLVARDMNPSLLELKYLIHLDLSGNDFQGSTIPEFFGLMKQLEYLNLNGANITGIVPSRIENMTSLKFLDLSFNSFNSSIPLWLGNLKNLVHLNLAYNQFNAVEGGLSMMLWNHCHLKSLNLTFNILEKESLDTIRYTSRCIGHDLEELQLRFMGLTGHLPDWLGQFKRLKVLSFSSNSFNGPIPASIGRLSDLRDLDLYSNLLSGFIPATICNLSALRYLDLSSNQLNGVIPATIWNLSALSSLDLSYNQLNGVIPATIGNLPTLRNLGLSFNQLKGVIPATIGNLSALRNLGLSSNQLKGVIPECLGQLSNLEYIYLGSNSLEGTLSEIHFSNLSKLYYFDIGYNHLSLNVKPEWVPPFQLSHIDLSSCELRTPFPPWLETQKKVSLLNLANASISGPLPNWLWSMHLYRLDLSKNRFTGSIPRNIGDTMPTLEILSLAYNLINGTIPSSFSKIHNLVSLDLSHNHITGSIPQNIGDTFPTLENFYFGDNLINGTIPISFCKIDTLISLDLSNNMVSGDIPNCWSGSNQLNALKLSSNELTGVIPISIGNLIELEWLYLKNNRLGGEVPLSLRNCKSLKLLNLAENKISGNIPTWIGPSLPSLQILRIQNNMFNGCIPLQLCQLTTLKVLDLAVNNLSGTIPQCFGNFSGMVVNGYNQDFDKHQYFDKAWDEVIVNGYNQSFLFAKAILEVSIDLSDNNLTGMIPEGLTILSGLIGLNLSHNHFIGSIPKSIGNLTSLEYLDFSTNQLSGNIPTSMSDLTWLRSLNLSYNTFSGKIPTGPQLQTLEDPSIYAGNLELCGAPLLKRCPVDEPPHAPTPDRHEENNEEDKSEKVWFYTITMLGYITGLWGVLGVLLFKKSWRYAYFQLLDNAIDWIFVRVAKKAAWLKKKMVENHAAN